MQKVHSIQFLRAIAAFAVLLFHLIGPAFVIGAAGVDVFFVISGFIMGAFAAGGQPLQFFYHRLVRIVPLYWAVTLAMCFGTLLGLFSNFSFTGAELWKSLLFVPYFDRHGLLAPLVEVGWTLNLEMFFYVIFALGLGLRAPILLTTIFLALMAAAGQMVEWNSPLMQSWTSPLLLEFIAGLLLSRLTVKSGALGAVALCLSLLGFVFAAVLGEQLGMLRVLSWGVPALLLVAGCVWLENAGRWPEHLLKPFELIGDASYALYLTHGLVISLVYKILAPGLLTGAVVIVVALLVSIAAHLLFEKPLIKLLKRADWTKRRSAGAVA